MGTQDIQNWLGFSLILSKNPKIKEWLKLQSSFFYPFSGFFISLYGFNERAIAIMNQRLPFSQNGLWVIYDHEMNRKIIDDELRRHAFILFSHTERMQKDVDMAIWVTTH